MSESIELEELKAQIRKLSRVTDSISTGGHLFTYHPQAEIQSPDSDFARLVKSFNRMIDRLSLHQKELEQRIQERTNELIGYRLAQERLNPHFLYNCLNLIPALVEQKSDQASRAIILLSDIARFSSDAVSRDSISLREEWGFLEEYLELMNLRLGDTFQLKIRRPPVLPALRVPPVSLQPLVENSFKHSFSHSDQPGKIQVTLEALDSDGFRFIVTDTGVSKSKKSGTGRTLGDIEHRFRFLYNTVSLELESIGENEGFETRLVVSGLKQETIV